ncbi:MAG: phosphatidylglycerophosphatase A [Campylobacterales bacterium]
MIRKLFLTVGGSGLSPIAPGTVGSLVALPLGLLVQHYIGTATLLLATLLVSVVAIKEIDRYLEGQENQDPSEIVIDELAGMWVALALTGHMPLVMQASLAFLAFRLFDIWKPSIIARAEIRYHGGIAVMADDLLAGLFGGILAAALYKGALVLGLI